MDEKLTNNLIRYKKFLEFSRIIVVSNSQLFDMVLEQNRRKKKEKPRAKAIEVSRSATRRHVENPRERRVKIAAKLGNFSTNATIDRR